MWWGGGGRKKASFYTNSKISKRGKTKKFSCFLLILSYQETFPGSLVSHKTSIRQQAFTSKLWKLFWIFFSSLKQLRFFSPKLSKKKKKQTIDFNVWPGGQSMEVINWCMCSDKNINLFLAVKHQELFNFGFLRKSYHK